MPKPGNGNAATARAAGQVLVSVRIGVSAAGASGIEARVAKPHIGKPCPVWKSYREPPARAPAGAGGHAQSPVPLRHAGRSRADAGSERRGRRRRPAGGHPPRAPASVLRHRGVRRARGRGAHAGRHQRHRNRGGAAGVPRTRHGLGAGECALRAGGARRVPRLRLPPRPRRAATHRDQHQCRRCGAQRRARARPAPAAARSRTS